MRDFAQGFFKDPSTRELLRYLSQSKRLTIFVGAGVSADQNVPKWSDLVKNLLQKELGKAHASLADEIVNSYFQLPVASMVDQMFQRGKDAGVRRRNESIRRQIYGTSKRPREFIVRPSLVGEILLFAAAAKVGGCDVHIVTTNYDCLFEELYLSDEVRKVYSTLKLQILPVATAEPRPAANQIPVVYVHGRIPRTGKISELIVFAEADYIKWMIGNDFRKYLTSRFDHGDTLILGASLRDYNIITYLGDTSSDDGRRIALMPVQGDPGYETSTPTNFGIFAALQAKRGEHLGIEMIHPDYFGQVFQFVHEALLATQRRIQGEDYDDIGYMSRVETWWDRFVNGRFTRDSWRRSATKQLQDLAAEFSAQTPEAAHVKIELWVRSNFSANNDPRELELCCSSQSMLLGDGRYWPHRVPLSPKREDPAVATFANRGATSARIEGRPYTRWSHYFGVPVILDKDPYLSVPVGVLIAYFDAQETGSDDLASVVASRGALAEKLAILGIKLLSV